MLVMVRVVRNIRIKLTPFIPSHRSRRRPAIVRHNTATGHVAARNPTTAQVAGKTRRNDASIGIPNVRTVRTVRTGWMCAAMLLIAENDDVITKVRPTTGAVASPQMTIQ